MKNTLISKLFYLTTFTLLLTLLSSGNLMAQKVNNSRQKKPQKISLVNKGSVKPSSSSKCYGIVEQTMGKNGYCGQEVCKRCRKAKKVKNND